MKNKFAVWRNASKPLLQTICNSFAGLDPANYELSLAADDLFQGLIEVLDNEIERCKNIEETKNMNG